MSGPWDHWAMIKEHFAVGTASGFPPVDVQFTPPAPVQFTEEPWAIYSRSGPGQTGSWRWPLPAGRNAP